MIIKKFQADTETEAMLKAKEELGSTAIVLNVKSIRHRGIMRLFKKDMVEVTAAVEENNASSSVSSAPSTEFNKAADEKIIPPAYQQFDLLKDNAIEERLNSLHALLEKKIEQESEKAADLVSKEEAEEEEKDEPVVAFLRMIYNTLLENEVQEKNANQILDEIEKTINENVSLDLMLSNIYQKLILKFGRVYEIKPAQKGPKVVFFVGPTGVGKTTTIAKIASKFKIEEDRKIAMFTADTYRIAAAEQLRTYANILEVPFQVIYTPEEIEEGIREYASCDYILVDTAGYSPNNNEQIDEMYRLFSSIKGHIEKDVFLVISATTKHKDLINIVKSYSRFENYKLIFTKLDETIGYGNILNIKMMTDAPMSYITNGQNVPDDIRVFDAQLIVKRLLGGN